MFNCGTIIRMSLSKQQAWPHNTTPDGFYKQNQSAKSYVYRPT